MVTHNCSSCGSGKEIDCASCKLAFLTEYNKRKVKMGKEVNNVEEDGDSISERLTAEGNTLPIWFLVLAAAATLLCVLGFTILMK